MRGGREGGRSERREGEKEGEDDKKIVATVMKSTKVQTLGTI